MRVLHPAQRPSRCEGFVQCREDLTILLLARLVVACVLELWLWSPSQYIRIQGCTRGTKHANSSCVLVPAELLCWFWDIESGILHTVSVTREMRSVQLPHSRCKVDCGKSSLWVSTLNTRARRTGWYYLSHSTVIYSVPKWKISSPDQWPNSSDGSMSNHQK